MTVPVSRVIRVSTVKVVPIQMVMVIQTVMMVGHMPMVQMFSPMMIPNGAILIQTDTEMKRTVMMEIAALMSLVTLGVMAH